MHARIEDSTVVEYPIINLRQRLPDTSLPADLTNNATLPSSFVYVHTTQPPTYDPNTQKLVLQSIPEYVNDKWQIGYSVELLTTEEAIQVSEQKAIEIRMDRNARLSASDWTQVQDAPVNQQAWAAYRQALRDITAQPGFPWLVEWPEAPE